MSTEPYPEVNVDESGIGPQQEQRGQLPGRGQGRGRSCA